MRRRRIFPGEDQVGIRHQPGFVCCSVLQLLVQFHAVDVGWAASSMHGARHLKCRGSSVALSNFGGSGAGGNPTPDMWSAVGLHWRRMCRGNCLVSRERVPGHANGSQENRSSSKSHELLRTLTATTKIYWKLEILGYHTIIIHQCCHS
jgi:hypothetical protein